MHSTEENRPAKQQDARQDAREKVAGPAQATRAPAGARVPAAEEPTVHAATVRFIEGIGDHDTEEDLHPARLDAAESDLEDALARSDLAERLAERDARDA